MFSSIGLVLLLGVSSVLSKPFKNHTCHGAEAEVNPYPGPCGAVRSDEEFSRAEAHFNAHKVNLKMSNLAASAHRPINIHWHVISRDNTPEGGNIPDSLIAAQIGVLNQDFGPVGFSWVLAETTRTVNADWFNTAGFDNTGRGNSEQAAMKASLRRGGILDLNIYSVGFTANPGLLAYSAYPWEYAGNPTEDGVVILFSTVGPGGTYYDHGLGKTLTHEVGHWCGLYHTFQGGCNGGGDGVDDTPSEDSPAFGCQVGRNTCSNRSGPDPIHNHMDYSSDLCKTGGWTPGQIARMQQQMSIYRHL